jgi:putative Flp pilus-assembly TadE/G-like protein
VKVVSREIPADRKLPSWRLDQSGNVAIVFALMAVVLMLAVGAAVDIGRWLHARDQTVGAVDAAVLAGARWLQTNSTDTAGAAAAAQNFYTQNVTSRLPVVNDTISFAVGSDGMSLTSLGIAVTVFGVLSSGSVSFVEAELSTL